MTTNLNLEPKARAFVAALEAANLPPFESGTAEQARALSRSLQPARTPPPVKWVSDHWPSGAAGPMLVREYRDIDEPTAALLFFHGGGWVLGGVDESDAFARRLAIVTGCAVYSVGYRLAPEAPYPAAVDDAKAALDWLATMTALPIVVMGDSAGGNLAAVVAARARDSGFSRIVLQVLAYPVTDARMNTDSYRSHASGPLLTAALMKWFWDQYLPVHADRLHPDASPLLGSMSGLPPAFVLVAENDPLRDEGEAYAEQLAVAGVPVTCKRYEGQIHSFLTMVGAFDGGAQALTDISAKIRSVVSK